MFKCRGYVLLLVMIFIQIVSALSLYALSAVSTTLKLQHGFYAREQSMQDAKALIKKLETQEMLGKSACVISAINVRDLRKKPQLWWDEYACAGSDSQALYYYTVEEMGADSCALIGEQANNQSIIADYYRITLRIQFNEHSPNIIIQSTIAKKLLSRLPCLGRKHHAPPGVQMRREI